MPLYSIELVNLNNSIALVFICKKTPNDNVSKFQKSVSFQLKEATICRSFSMLGKNSNIHMLIHAVFVQRLLCNSL